MHGAFLSSLLDAAFLFICSAQAADDVESMLTNPEFSQERDIRRQFYETTSHTQRQHVHLPKHAPSVGRGSK